MQEGNQSSASTGQILGGSQIQGGNSGGLNQTSSSGGNGTGGSSNNGGKRKNFQREEIKQAFETVLGLNNRLEFQQQKQFKRDVFRLLELDAFMLKSNESDIKYFLAQLAKVIKTNRVHYDILLEIMIKMAVQGTLTESLGNIQNQLKDRHYKLYLIIANKDIEASFNQCFGDLNNSNSFVDKKVKCKIFYDQTHETIYDSFFDVLQPINEKNCLKYLIFFRKVCRGHQELEEEEGLSIIHLIKVTLDKQVFSANCLDIQITLFISKLWWMMVSSPGVVEERGKSLKAEYDALKILMGHYKKQLAFILDKMYAYIQKEMRNQNKKENLFYGIIFFILFLVCKIKNVLNSQITNPAFISLISSFLRQDNHPFLFPLMNSIQVSFNSESMMLKNFRRCIAEKIPLSEAFDKLIYNVISNSLINNTFVFFRLLDILDEASTESEVVARFSADIKNKLLFQSLLDTHPINSLSTQQQAFKKTQEFFQELSKRKISINSCYSTYYLQQLRNRYDIFEFVRQILLHPSEPLSNTFIDTLNSIKLLSPQFLKMAEKVAKTLKNEEEIQYFVFNMKSLNKYLTEKLIENAQYKELFQYIQFKDLLMMLCNVLIQQYELVQEDRKNEILLHIITVLDILKKYCLEDIENYQYVRADIQVSCEFIRLITRFLLLSGHLHRQSIVQYILIIVTSTCLFSQKRTMTLFLEIQEQTIGFSLDKSNSLLQENIFSMNEEFTQTSIDFIAELNLGVNLSKKIMKNKLVLSQKEALSLFLYKFFLKQNLKTGKFFSEQSQNIKDEIYPKLKDEDIKNNSSLSRKIIEVVLLGFKFEKNITAYTSYHQPFYSNHPFDQFIRDFVVENKFFYTIVYHTFLKDDSPSLTEFFMSMMLNIASMFHNTQFKEKPHWTLRKTFKAFSQREMIPPNSISLMKYFEKLKNQTIEHLIYLFYDYCIQFKAQQSRGSSIIPPLEKLPYKLKLKGILMSELKVIAEDYISIMNIFE